MSNQAKIEKERREYARRFEQRVKQGRKDTGIRGDQWSHKCFGGSIVIMSLNNPRCGLCGTSITGE